MTQEDAEKLTGMKFTPGWFFHEIKRHESLAGFVMQQGNEVHVFRLSEFDGRWFTRQDVERVMAPILSQYGEVVTKVRKTNQTGRAFCERIGFKPVAEDDHVIHYKAERFNHARL